MAMRSVPLAGDTKDYASKKYSSKLINMRMLINEDGSFQCVKRVDGLTNYLTVGGGPLRSGILENSGFAYVVSGTNLFRFNSGLVVEDLGAIGGGGRCKIVPNAFPFDNEILIINGDGEGYTYNNANGLVKITDPDFFSTSSITILNEQFWAVRDDTNEFFGSQVSNGQVWPAGSLGVSAESPDNVKAVIAKKSALWVLNAKTVEYYQTYSNTINPEFPLRLVLGATLQRGIVAVESLAEVENVFAWLADDGTVRMVNGTVMSKISDLDLETRIAGDGTLRRPGTTTLSDSYAFWIDSTIYKTYNLTIPSLGITWVYDLMTGKSHIRESRGIGVWRGVSSGSFNGKALVCGFDSNQIYFVDVNAFDEGGEILSATIGMPSISFDVNVNIPLIEIDMEVGVGLNDGQGSDPKMIVEYSKDGGITFTNWGSIDLGKIGEYRKRVPMRLFGQLVRHKDFIIQYRITDPVEVTIYGHYFDIKGR